jgi:hypothetical protein
MSIVLKIGKGCPKGVSHTFDIGQPRGDISNKMLDWTIREYAETVAKQAKIIDGEITLFSINLSRSVSKSSK